MTYPVPSFSTVAGAQAVGGVDLNRLVDGVNDLNTRLVNTNGRVRLRRAANQSINTGASTAMSWDTEDQDNGGFIVVTATTVTVPTGQDGQYNIMFRVQGPFTGAGRAFLEINVTSAVTGITNDYRQPMSSTEQRGLTNAAVPLLAGDTFVCNVFHSTGSAVNFTGLLNCIRISAV